MALHQHVQRSDDTGVTMNPLYSGELRELPRFRLSETELPEETSYQLVHDELHPRATVVVRGAPRTNGPDPRADIFATIAARAWRTFWLNPEPRLYWNYGDSVIDAYARYCTAFECWTTHQLEDFVKALTRAPGAF